MTSEAEAPITMTVDQLHAALNAERIKAGLSWRQLASEAGTSPSSMSRMPRCSPSLETYLKLADWLAGRGGNECGHEGKIMVGGIGTLNGGVKLVCTCLLCGRELTTNMKVTYD